MTKKVLAVILALAMALSVMSVCVSAIPSPMSPMAPVGNFSLAINIGSDEYHGLFIGGALVPLPHSFSGDTCVNCGYVKPAEEEEEPEEEPVKEETKPAKKVLKYTPSKDSVYVLEKTGGQDFDDKTVAGGLELVTSNGRTRLATSWQSSGVVYTEMVNALKDNTDCVIKITYTGTITAFGIESENAGIIDVDCETVKGDDFNVMTVSVADFLETGSAAVADTGWRNIYVVAEDGAKLYGFEITPPPVN